MADVLKKFGRYFLLDQVAQGGMAEIYRARLATPGDAGRLLVIKKIQAGYGANPEFVSMFKSEIKVTMGFNHPNIVQLYDFGEEKNQPYIAMEYVDGKNLRQFISRFGELRQFFPIELAAHIVEQAASGLHYAHSFKDKISGQPLNIVHRDISPQNVLISFEGTVKVIDFGIAKAANNSESTRAGVIKGKPSYLSPEQISGETLDGRSDIFSLATVLWELLTGKKLFAGENDLAVLKLIESCQTHVKPPSTINPKVPKELDYIVLKGLAKQREKRYQTAEEMQRALHKFLYGFAPDFNPSDLSYYAKDLFKDQIVEDRKRIQRLNDEVEKLLAIASRPVEVVGGAGSLIIDKDATGTGITGTLPSGAREVFSDAKGAPKLEIEVPKPAPASSHKQSSGSSSRRSSSSSSSSSGSRPSSSSRPALVRGYQMGSKGYTSAPAQHKDLKARNKSQLTKILGGLAAAVVVAAIYAPQVLGPVGGLLRDCSYNWPWCAETNNPVPPPIRDVASNAKSARLRLIVLPPGGKVRITVNDKEYSAENPVVPVKLDTNVRITVERDGYKTKQVELAVRNMDLNVNGEVDQELSLEPMHFGYLTLTTAIPVDAEIFLDGPSAKPWVLRAPLRELKLPVGNYAIRLSHQVLGVQKVIEARIDENKVLQLEPTLDIRPTTDSAPAPNQPRRR